MTTPTEVASSAAKTATGGFPVLGILTVIFVVGKVMGKLAWPWVWVLAPLWAPYAIGLGIIAIIFIIAIIGALFSKIVN